MKLHTKIPFFGRPITRYYAWLALDFWSALDSVTENSVSSALSCHPWLQPFFNHFTKHAKIIDKIALPNAISANEDIQALQTEPIQIPDGFEPLDSQVIDGIFCAHDSILCMTMRVRPDTNQSALSR